MMAHRSWCLPKQMVSAKINGVCQNKYSLKRLFAERYGLLEMLTVLGNHSSTADDVGARVTWPKVFGPCICQGLFHGCCFAVCVGG